MVRQSIRLGWVVGAVAIGLLVSTTSALGQAQGNIRGVILDEAGKGVPEADVVFEYIGDVDITVTTRTNIRGEFTRVGMRTGEWKMQATKGKMVGRQTVKVLINEMRKVDDLVIKEPVAGAPTDTTGMTAKDIEERNKKMAAAQADFEAGVAAIQTDPDLAITKLTEVAGLVPNCAICYSKIGDAQVKKADAAAAEAAYTKAIELDPKLADPYSALAVLYNQQKKFDDATKMSQKANEILGSSATGGDPATVFNQGIILWNQGGKAAEAKVQFEKAITLDPKMADAYYWLGMASVNLGQLPDAAKAFEEYIKIAPEGQYIETAKAILKQIK